MLKSASNRPRGGERLVAAGIISEEQLHHALRLMSHHGGRVEDLVVEIGFVTEAALLKALSTRYGIRFVSTNKLFLAQVDPRIVALVPFKFARAHCMFPVLFDAASSALLVATPDPDNTAGLEAIKLTGQLRDVRPVVAMPAAVEAAIARAYGNNPQPFEALIRMAQPGSDASGSFAAVTPSSGQWPLPPVHKSSLSDVAEASGERSKMPVDLGVLVPMGDEDDDESPTPPPVASPFAAQAPQVTPIPANTPAASAVSARPPSLAVPDLAIEAGPIEGLTIGGRYVVMRKLGEGGMGTVYEGQHLGTNRRVAIKILPSALARQPALVARFEIEAKSAGQIESRHITQVLDVGVHGANPYLVMEYLDGEDLQQLIRRVGPLHRELAIRIVAQACAGLVKAHERGIIHRDVKPANIFLARQDGDVVVKIVDFGIAKVRAAQNGAESGLTSPGKVFGSPFYMSPEQVRAPADVDCRTDIWSLGVVLYECLSGATPFHMLDSLPQLIFAICSQPIPNLHERAPWVAADLLHITWRALQADVSKRYAKATDMWSELRALAPGGTTIDDAAIQNLPSRNQTGPNPLRR